MPPVKGERKGQRRGCQMCTLSMCVQRAARTLRNNDSGGVEAATAEAPLKNHAIKCGLTPV